MFFEILLQLMMIEDLKHTNSLKCKYHNFGYCKFGNHFRKNSIQRFAINLILEMNAKLDIQNNVNIRKTASLQEWESVPTSILLLEIKMMNKITFFKPN